MVTLHLVLSSPLFLLLSLSYSLSQYPSLSPTFALCTNQSTLSKMFIDTFKLYFAVREILRGIKEEIFSFSLSPTFHSLSLYASPFHSLSLSIPLPFTLSLISHSLSLSFYLSLSLSFYLSLSLSFSLSLLSIFLSGVSNGRFRHCS